MAGIKRTQQQIAGAGRAEEAARINGAQVRTSRTRRHLTQKALANKVGISRGHLADIEAGNGAATPMPTWFALAEALGRPFKAEFVRDSLEPPADAGHLDIQQLLLRMGQAGGYDRRVELPWRSGNPSRWTDVVLVSQLARRLILCECVNVVGDIGASLRSSDRKVADAQQVAVAIAGDGAPYEVGLVWIVRDTARNRELVSRYEHIFASRFPGSSVGWVKAITAGAQFPSEPGLVWCDVKAIRLFAWRRISGRRYSPSR